MSSISVSPRTGQQSLKLPAEDVAGFLPQRIKAAIDEANRAAKRVSEVATALNDGERLLSDARRMDLTERADAVSAGRPDPGAKHASAAQAKLDSAVRELPIAEELHRRAVVGIQRIAQALPEKEVVDLGTAVVRKHRRLMELMDQAEVCYGDEARGRSCLEWLLALRADEPVGRRGAVQLGDAATYFDRIRVALTTKDGAERIYDWERRNRPQRAVATTEPELEPVDQGQEETAA